MAPLWRDAKAKLPGAKVCRFGAKLGPVWPLCGGVAHFVFETGAKFDPASSSKFRPILANCSSLFSLLASRLSADPKGRGGANFSLSVWPILSGKKEALALLAELARNTNNSGQAARAGHKSFVCGCEFSSKFAFVTQLRFAPSKHWPITSSLEGASRARDWLESGWKAGQKLV